MIESPDTDLGTSAGVSRRAVVGAAWAVPVVLLAVAAPSAAASGPSAGAMFFNNSTPFSTGPTSVTVNIGVRFQVAGAPQPLTLVAVTLQLPLPTSRVTAVDLTGFPSGWTGSWAAASGGIRVLTLSWTGVLAQGTNLSAPAVKLTVTGTSTVAVNASVVGTDSAGNTTAVLFSGNNNY